MIVYKIIIIAAVVFSVITIAILLMFIFGESESLNGYLEMEFKEMISFFFFPIGIIAGMVVSWWKQITGAIISLASLAIFYLLHLIFWKELPGGAWFLIFVSPAFLFLIAGFIKGNFKEK